MFIWMLQCSKKISKLKIFYQKVVCCVYDDIIWILAVRLVFVVVAVALFLKCLSLSTDDAADDRTVSSFNSYLQFLVVSFSNVQECWGFYDISKKLFHHTYYEK